MVEQAWRIVQPVLDAWKEDRSGELPLYQAGSAGPSEADELLTRSDRRWRAINGADPEKSS
jgi:glucose-6-phosphate 1-dehydrogenase